MRVADTKDARSEVWVHERETLAQGTVGSYPRNSLALPMSGYLLWGSSSMLGQNSPDSGISCILLVSSLNRGKPSFVSLYTFLLTWCHLLLSIISTKIRGAAASFYNHWFPFYWVYLMLPFYIQYFRLPHPCLTVFSNCFATSDAITSSPIVRSAPLFDPSLFLKKSSNTSILLPHRNASSRGISSHAL